MAISTNMRSRTHSDWKEEWFEGRGMEFHNGNRNWLILLVVS